MTNFVALPLVITLAAAVGGSRLWVRLRPAIAAALGTISFAAVLAAAVPTLWVLGLSGVSHFGISNPVFDWSYHLLPDNKLLGSLLGIGSLTLAVIGTARATRVILMHRRIRCSDTAGIEVVDSDDVFAYTLPGPARTIAVSSGLRASLTGDEYRVVMAHEQTHADHRHDRILLLAQLTTAFVPFIRSSARRLEFLLERWADENAAAAVDGDRRFVAVTIAKVALSSTAPFPALGIGGHGVAARTDALMSPPTVVCRRLCLLSVALLAVTVSQAVAQLHHTAELGTGLFR